MKPTLSHLSALCAMALVATSASATVAVPTATVSTALIAGSGLVQAPEVAYDHTFGPHRLTSGAASASATVGATEAAVPFIAFSAAASGASFAVVDASLSYQWSIAGAGEDGERVPVTITTLGHIWGRVTATSLDPDVPAGADASWLGVGVSSRFYLYEDGRSYERTHGVSAGLGLGVPFADFGGAVLSAPGGSVTASGAGAFTETFSLLVMPNLFHTITMQAHGTPLSSALYNEGGFSWALGGYIDPVITIDPAYVDRFSLVQSSLPTVAMPVPEASTLALMFSGLAGLWLAVGRREAHRLR